MMVVVIVISIMYLIIGFFVAFKKFNKERGNCISVDFGDAISLFVSALFFPIVLIIMLTGYLAETIIRHS